MQINEDKQLAEYDKLQTRKCLLEFKEKKSEQWLLLQIQSGFEKGLN